MIDNLLGNDDTDTDTEPDVGEESFEDEDLFDGSGSDMDDGGGLAGGDDMAFDDGGEAGDATPGEMDNRINDLENEVASLSSTVDTVKSENDRMAESIDDVQENVRKLLEIYEMVTRGVNPFVDETEPGGDLEGGPGAAGQSIDLGLFEDEDEDENTSGAAAGDESDADTDGKDRLEEDVTTGSDPARESGNDEIGNDGPDGPDDGSLADEGSDTTPADGLENPVDGGSGGEGEAAADGDGQSFEELKAEYESRKADRLGDVGTDPDDPTPDSGVDDPADGAEHPGAADGRMNGEESPETTARTSDSTAASGADDGDARGPAGGLNPNGADPDAAAPGRKPYLEAIPSGYVIDVIVLEWLEYLVEEAGIDGAARTIAYYRAVGWLDEPAAETLWTFLNGFGDAPVEDPEPSSPLTVTHHEESLRYVSRIANPDADRVAFAERPSAADDAGPSVPRATVPDVLEPTTDGPDDPDHTPTTHNDPDHTPTTHNDPDPAVGAVESDGGRSLRTPECSRRRRAGRYGRRREPEDGGEEAPHPVDESSPDAGTTDGAE